jgi:hypothetical protein
MNEKIAKYLTDDYHFNIQVTEGFCPDCYGKGKVEIVKIPRDSVLDSPTSRSQARQCRFESWMELFEDEGVDAIQTINSYTPSKKQDGKVTRNPQFAYPILAMDKPGIACKNKSLCSPICLICNTALENLPTVTINNWTVHDVCSDPCGFVPPGVAKGVCCKTPTLAIPKFFKDALGISLLCPEHGPNPKSKPAVPVTVSVRPRPRPTAAPTPGSEHRPPAAPKPQAKRKLLGIERRKETGTHNICKMMWPDQYVKNPTAKPEPEQPKREAAAWSHVGGGASAGRLGASFLYGESGGFDFTPPRSLAESDALAQKNDEDVAGAGAGDGNH